MRDEKPTLCLLHPGAMGSALGAAARRNGHRVLWVPQGRGGATVRRAEQDGLEAAGSLAGALAQSAIVLSVCPPHAALAVAQAVAAHGFAGVYCDANAVSPETVRAVADSLVPAGAAFVDGGIIGAPPRGASTVRLCLAGAQAPVVADVFAGTTVQPLLLGPRIGAASAMKICYAAWTKGTMALLESICAVAQHEEVLDPLLAEWRASQPDLEARLAHLPATVGKSWRWEGEMQEVAQLFEAAGLPGGFHQAAADVFRRLAGFKDQPAVPLAQVVEMLAPPGSRAAGSPASATATASAVAISSTPASDSASTST